MRKNNGLFMAAALAGLVMGSTSMADHHMKGEAKGKAAKAGKAEAKGQCHHVNTCGGKGACGGKTHACAGKNSCKGKGWLKMSQKDCEAACKKSKQKDCFKKS